VKTKIYIFSGLGVDERVFQKLDFSAYDCTFVKWIQPLTGESIQSYAARISVQIKDPGAIYIGLSFGGIMAAEVVKCVAPSKLILLASVKTKYEIPLRYRLAGLFFLHRLIPAKWLLKANRITYWFFGAQTTEEKIMLREILKDTDPVFLKWAMGEILSWKNKNVSKNTVHLHGSDDHILPYRKVNADFCIHNGGHLMTLSHASEIQLLLDGLIAGN